MSKTLTIVLIMIVSLVAVAIVCAVNAPSWLDGRPVATKRPV